MSVDYLWRARYLPSIPQRSVTEWRWIPGYEGVYRVSNQGVVESVPRYGHPELLELRPNVDANGYPRVHLSKGGVSVSRRMHRFVTLAFLGPCPDGLEVRHLNGNPMDNRLVNLVYGTKSENAYDVVRHGNNSSARKTHCVQGHEFTPKNTHVNAAGWRRCRACSARVTANRKAARKAADEHDDRPGSPPPGLGRSASQT